MSWDDFTGGKGKLNHRHHLAIDGVVGAADVCVAVGDEQQVNGVDEAVVEDPGEVVDDEAGAVGAERLVVEREGHLGRSRGLGRNEDDGGRQEQEEEEPEEASHGWRADAGDRPRVREAGLKLKVNGSLCQWVGCR